MESPMMRSLPQSIEAEQSVIGAMIIDKSAIAQVFEKLNEDDFVEVFYLFSRTVEHNIVLLPNIYKNIKEAGYDTLAYMTILVR